MFSPGVDVARSPTSSGFESASVYRPQLDGIRALAVTLVLLFHLELGWFGGGFIGVDVFFVLSGYLITGLLVDEATRRGAINLLRFYARRARRLLPAAWVVIAFVLAISMWHASPLIFHDRQHEASAALLYVANWDWILRNAEYFAPGDVVSPLLHFWSLSVEEQFYLFWPALILVVWRSALRRGRAPLTVLLVVLAALTALSATWAVITTPSLAAYYGTHTRVFELAAGGLLAVVVRRRIARRGSRTAEPERDRGADWSEPAMADRVQRTLVRNPVAGRGLAPHAVTLGAVLGAAVLIWQSHAIAGTSNYPGLAGLVVTAGSVLLIWAVEVGNTTISARVMGNPLFAWVGRLSYSIYVWHWPIIVFFRDNLGPLLVPVILMVSWLSYTLVEQPIRRLARPTLSPKWVVATGLAVSLTLALVVGPALVRTTGFNDIIYAAATDFADKGDCPYRGDEWDRVADASACLLRTGNGQTVAFVGDSHAHQWQPALLTLAAERDWTLVRVTRGACGAPDLTPMHGNGEGGLEPDESCAAWRHKAYQQVIDEYDPDLVFVATRSQVVGFAAADGQVVMPGDADHLRLWTQGWDWTLDTLGGGGATVVVSAILPTLPQDVPQCLSRWGLSSGACDFSAADPVAARYSDAVEALLVERGSGVMVRPVDLVCPDGFCPAVDGDLIVHRDTNHITATYVATLATEFGAMLDAAAGPAAR